MDASGNLTDVSEFSNGRRIRLISRLSSDVALGLHAFWPAPTGGSGFIGELSRLVAPALNSSVSAHRLSLGGNETTVLRADAIDGGFTLSWADQPGCFLYWTDGQFGLFDDRAGTGLVASIVGAQTYDKTFTIDWVDGCWFALNNHDHSRVADVRGGSSDERTQIVSFGWNGGDNQIWRAQAV
ncbi:MAG: hypothetical protein EON87_01990 [Brevundimonas sp.]|nr:MAG: hypothetical protein EON87_01990 [Brevundimonas sp.]